MTKYFNKYYHVLIAFGCFCLILLSNFIINHAYANDIKTLKIATEPAFAPFESQAQNGELVGFDIDLINAIGKVENFQIDFESLPFDGIIPALRTSTVDAAISAITITPERQQVISFTRPYFKAGLAIAVRTGNTDIAGIESLQGKSIGVHIGTTGANKAKEIPDAMISTFDSAPLALQELQNGNVDAVINDAPVTLYAIESGTLKDVKVVGELLTEEFYGIATPKNSSNLNIIDKGLKLIIENGTYAQIYQKWFDVNPPKLPEKAPV